MKKICTHCKEEKEVSEFYKDKYSKDGYTTKCKNCRTDLANNKYTHICNFCSKEFKTAKKDSLFCSNKCSKSYRYKDNRVVYNCDYCGKEHSKKKSHYERMKHNFCSPNCSQQFQSVHYVKENNVQYDRIEVKCSQCNEKLQVIKSIYESRKNFFCNSRCMGDFRKGKNCGEKSPVWRFDKTDEERSNDRSISGYKDFVRETFKRDNYTCQYCGKLSNGDLVAHHLNGYNWDIENRTNVDNAVTLCEECHETFHKIYKKGKNTKEQYEEWIKNKNKENERVS